MPASRTLVIHPFEVTGDLDNYDLINQRFRPFEKISGSEYGNPKAVRGTVRSREYSKILIYDQLWNHEWFSYEFGGCLKDFVDDGGVIAFFTSNGASLLQRVLQPVFHVDWELGSSFNVAKKYFINDSWCSGFPR